MSLIADVFDVILIDSVTGEAFGSTTLTNANIEVNVTTNDVRGGKGNQLIAILHASRDININLTDVGFRYDWLATQLGTNIVTGAGIGYTMPKWYTVTDNADSVEITLDEQPVATDNGLKIYDENGVAITGFTVAGNKVTFSTGVEAGDKVEVRTYKYDTDPTTETIEINNKIFPKSMICVLETLEIDDNEIPTHKIQYQFENAIPTGSFTINTTSERNANATQFNLRVLKSKTSDTVGKVLRIPIS